MSEKISLDVLKTLRPVGALSDVRLRELIDLCYVEVVSQYMNPFRVQPSAGQSVYLLQGEMELIFSDGTRHLQAGTEAARTPIIARGQILEGAKAQTDCRLVRIDDDLLDILMTWDQITAYEARNPVPAPAAAPENKTSSEWMLRSGMFSATNLKYGAIAQLPPTAVEELLIRIERVPVRAGQVVIKEGDEGDFYYLIESGTAVVTRVVGGVVMTLAELKSGDAFGEEALVSDSKRNATVTMKQEGVLLRLAKQDFVQLLKEPLLNKIDHAEAMQRVGHGAIWLDVRYPSEYQYDKLDGALNIPLGEIRNAANVMDKSKEYIAYCQSGRRSSAAAFILAQHGYRISMLSGGLWALAARK